ncbi:MAG: hypothetical protein CSA23_02440 [Deltaproteobacteria bacterium]|nr:MAG: hypothetical protein CSA23_02440 [Deltaproteobacteria bacterium]
MLTIIDTSLLVAAGASFVAGLAGYIIVRLWIMPIMRYRSTRRKLRRELTDYISRFDHLPDENQPTQGPESGEKQLKRARRYAMEMVDHYTHQIPVWYRLLLDSRGESPLRASDLLSNMGKIKNSQQRFQRVRKACKAMGLK